MAFLIWKDGEQGMVVEGRERMGGQTELLDHIKQYNLSYYHSLTFLTEFTSNTNH